MATMTAEQGPMRATRVASPWIPLARPVFRALWLPSCASNHVVGASMGGMIAQTMAIEHSSRVRTLTSIMSTTGARDLPTAEPHAMAALLAPVVADRDGNIERSVGIFRAIGSPGFPFDETRVRRRAALAYDRGFHPAGVGRQLVAIMASGSRREALRAVRVPALVVHGTADPLVPLAGGVDTAHSIPGARTLYIEGMGHDLPRDAWGQIVDAIVALANAAVK
jgi:pimeloyl-ACP methyl ester carboxylesterase